MMRSSDPLDPRAVLGAVKGRPGSGGARREVSATADLDRSCARRIDDVQAGTKEQPSARTKEPRHERSTR